MSCCASAREISAPLKLHSKVTNADCHDRSSDVTVSIVVTTYNRLGLLKQTIQSILSQTFRDFELIVVDNESQDGTLEYLQGLGTEFVRAVQNQNYGVIAANRNVGIQQSRGKYVAFCDDDDMWLPDKLEKQVSVMERSPRVGLCYTNAALFRDGITLRARMVRWRVRRYYFPRLLLGNFIPNSSVLVRRSVFEHLGLLTTDTTLREDYEMWLRVARDYDLAYIDEPLIRYRVHGSNVAGNKASETLRAMRTVRSIRERFGLSTTLVLPFIGFQYLKYLGYLASGHR